MGKGFGKGKLRGIFVGVFLLAVLFPALCVCASYREFELFDKGYEYYLSYHPEEAVETFRTFLGEFPRSSAADAALFWLGRCSLQLRAYEDAGKYFSEIRRQFPDSPFVRYVEKEVASLPITDVGKERDVSKGGLGGKAKVADAGGMSQEKKDGSEGKISAAPEGGEKQESRPPGGEERKEERRTDTAIRDEDGIGKKEAVTLAAPAGGVTYTVQAGAFKSQKAANRLRLRFKKKGYSATVKKTTSGGGVRFNVTVGEFKARSEAQEFADRIRRKMDLYAFPVEMERADAVKRGLPSGMGPVDSVKGNVIDGSGLSVGAVKTDMNKGPNAAAGSKGNEITAVIISEKRYSASEISDNMQASSAALVKAEIQVIPWRSGNAFEDFVSEQVLYDEAKGSGLAADSEKLEELSSKYKLTAVESAHIERYLVVLGLVQRKMAGMSEEGLVESLAVKYSEAGSQEKVALAAKLQEHARNGKSFEEISRLYPDSVTFSTMKVGDLQVWLKDSIRGLKSGEISVVWKRDGYMILRALETGPSSGVPAVDSSDENATKIFVKGWIEELKKSKGIVIVYQ